VVTVVVVVSVMVLIVSDNLQSEQYRFYRAGFCLEASLLLRTWLCFINETVATESL
jgi:hypothetical protein